MLTQNFVQAGRSALGIAEAGSLPLYSFSRVTVCPAAAGAETTPVVVRNLLQSSSAFPVRIRSGRPVHSQSTSMACVPRFQTATVYEGILAGAIVQTGPIGTYGR